MLTAHDIERLRRSHAMAPLGPNHVAELLDTAATMAAERRQIAALLTGLPRTVAELRTALNQLHTIVAG